MAQSAGGPACDARKIETILARIAPARRCYRRGPLHVAIAIWPGNKPA